MRKFVTGLLYCAMLKVYEKEKLILNYYWNNNNSYNDQNNSVLGNFMLILVGKMFEVKKFIANSQ